MYKRLYFRGLQGSFSISHTYVDGLDFLSYALIILNSCIDLDYADGRSILKAWVRFSCAIYDLI